MVRRAFTAEVRQERQTARARWRSRQRRVEARVVQAEQAQDPLGGHGAVERRHQWQPAASRVAERGGFAEWIDGRLVTVGEASAGRPETHDHGAFGHGADAERGHHVVATPGADGDTGVQPQRLAASGRSRPSTLSDGTIGGSVRCQSRWASMALSTVWL